MNNSAFNMDENIIAKLGLQDLPETERLKMLDQMADLVQKRVMLRIMDELPEADVAKANELADRPEEMMAFIGGKVDMMQLILDETERLKQELFAEVSEPKAEELENAPKGE